MFLGLGVGAGLSPADTTPPTLSSAIVPSNGLSLTLTYSEALDTGSVPATTDYTLAGTLAAITGVNVTGGTVVLTLSPAVDNDDVVSVTYVVPGSGKVRDSAGNNAAALTTQAVTNNSTVTPADVTPPTLSTAIINAAGTSLVLTYNEALDTGSTPATSAYSLSGTSAAVTAVAVVGSAVTLTLSPAAQVGETVLLGYTAPGSGKVRDVAHNSAANLSSQATTNNSLALITANRVLNFSTRFGDDTTHLTTGGTSKVQQFVNQDGGAAWAQGTSGSQASWELDSLVSSLNGLPCVHPDGGDFYLGTDAAVLAIATGNSDHTYFALVSPDTALQYGTFFSWGNSASASGYLAYGIDVTGVLFGSSTAAFRLASTVLSNKRPRVCAFKRVGNLLKVWLDGVAETVDGSGAFAVGALTSVNRCSKFSRCRSTNDLKLTGQSGEDLLYNTALADAQVVAQSLALKELWQLAYYRLVTLGDSLSNGYSSTSGLALADRVVLSSNGGKWQRYSGSTNGYTSLNTASVFAARITARRRWAAAHDVMHIWVGTNDAAFTADSAATIYGRITTQIDDAQALGYRVVISTCILRPTTLLQNSGAGPATANSIITALNTLIMANSAGAEAVYDAYTALNVTAGANPDTFPNSYYTDGTHLTDLGYNLLAAGQQAAIDAVA